MADKLKTLIKLANNFLKMLNEESCEVIKIKFWGAMEEQIKNINLDNEIIVKLVIDEILNKNSEILTNKNLLYCFVTFLTGKSTKAFCEGFYEILIKFLQDYEEKQNFFQEHLGDLSINLFFKNLELSENISKENEFFCNLIEIDHELFSVLLMNKIDLIESEDEEKGFSYYLNKNNFSLIFSHLITKLLQTKNIDSLLYYFEKIEKIKTNSQNIESLFKYYQNILKNFIHFLNNYDEVNFQKTLMLSLKIAKQVQNILKFGLKENIINSEEPTEFYRLLNSFILILTEFIHSNKKLNFCHLEIFLKFLELKIPILQRSEKYLISLILSNKEQIYDSTSLVIFLKFLNKFKESITNQNVNLIITQIILNSLNSTNKMKYSNSNKSVKELKYITHIKNKKQSDDELVSDNHIGSYYNLSNFKIIFYFVESCFDLRVNENNSEVIEISLYEDNLLALMKTLNCLNFELFDLDFQNFLFKFIFECLYVFYLIPIKAQSEKFHLSENIFEQLFKNLKKISNKSFLKNEIYPIVINCIQTIFIPNFQTITQISQNNEESIGSKIFDHFFNFLFDFSRDDSIAHLTSKLIISLYNLKLADVYSHKVYALNKFVDLVVLTNSSKFFVIYFNFINENLKVSGSENNYTTCLLYDSLYKYSLKYEGALQSAYFDFVFSRFEKNFEALPDEYNLESLFSLNAILNILVKDQPENLITKFYDHFHNTKFLKIFDKIFKFFATGTKVSKLDEGRFWDILSNINKSIKTEHISKNLSEFNLTNLVLTKCLDSDHILIGILLALSKIFSLFVSNIIIHNKNSFDMKNLSDQNNKTISSLIKTFDYITNGILLSKENTSSFTPHILFLNEVFTHIDNLIFFYDVHSNLTAINVLEQNNLDYSLLNEVNTKIVSDKNKRFLDYLMSGENYIYLMKNLFNNLISYETNVINLLDHKKENNLEANHISSFVIDSLYDNQNILNLAKENSALSENKKLNPYFTKIFLEALNKLSDKKDANVANYLKINHSIYHFLLLHNIFLKYFRNIQHFMNLNLLSVYFYYTLKTWKSNEIKKHFLQFILYFMKSDKNIFLFALRICLNKNIFKKIFIEKDNLKISVELNTVIEYLLMQLIFFNSYKNESINYISTLLRNIQSLCVNTDNENNRSVNMDNTLFLGGLLSKIYSILKSHSFDGKITINKKFKDNLTQVLNEEFLIKYLQDLFVNSIDRQGSIVFIENNLTKYMENFDIILNLKEMKILFDNNQIQDNLEKTKLSENVLFKNILLFDEFSFPMQLNIFLTNYCQLITSKENVIQYLVDNYLLYQVSVKNNQAKLIFDITKTLLLNKTFSDCSEFNLIKWEDKFTFISMLLLNLLNDSSIKQNVYKGKSENFKSIGSIIHINLIKK